jgi:Bifunctional DNA primase/polymerase, N-terminal
MTGLVSSGPGAALARGLAVFPIAPGQRKAPPGWQIRASTDPGQPWPPGSNVGVGCRASGVVVLDLDRKNGVDGVATLQRLCAAHEQPSPQTFTVATANGGLHLYFTAPPARVVVNTIGILGRGIDVRAPGRMSATAPMPSPRICPSRRRRTGWPGCCARPDRH